jgi:hypothetical protein
MRPPRRRTPKTPLAVALDVWDSLALLLLLTRALHRLAIARHRPRAHATVPGEPVAVGGSNRSVTWGQPRHSTSWDAEAERRTDVRRERRLLLAEIAAVAIVIGLVLVRAMLLS